MSIEISPGQGALTILICDCDVARTLVSAGAETLLGAGRAPLA